MVRRGAVATPEWPVLTPLDIAVGAGAVLAATTVAAVVEPYVSESDIIMLYVVAVTLAAHRVRLTASILTAVSSVVAFNFFFTEPRYTFLVHDTRYLLTFVTMGGTGVLIGGLAARARRDARTIREREEQGRELYLAAETERIRSTLLSSVSHDLRTPLATITGAATTLLDGRANLDDAARRALLRRVTEEARRLERLLGNILEMTRLDAGGIVPTLDWHVPEEIVGTAIARVAPIANGRPIVVQAPPRPILARLDAVLAEQLVANYLENALVHAPGDSPIEVTVREDGEEVLLEVADRGPGLGSAHRERLFEKFVRGRRASVGGAGLGLAICRAIAHVHGGRTWAHERDGGGAVFGVALPRGGPDHLEVPAFEDALRAEEPE